MHRVQSSGVRYLWSAGFRGVLCTEWSRAEGESQR